MPGCQRLGGSGDAPRVFGPVPSWRLGRSLGVDLAPFKRCNWNCVYCQLGRTRPLCSQPRSTPGVQEVLTEVGKALESTAPRALDWITLLGSGEPLLCDGIGEILRGVKALTPLPVALLTNGALLADPRVRAKVRAADAILPSLSAPTPELHLALHRPHPRFSYPDHIRGLSELRQEYTGRLWVEVMLVAGANDGEDALRRLAERLQPVAPDEIHLNRPSRPPAEAWVRPPTPQAMARARDILGEVAAVRTPGKGGPSPRTFPDGTESLGEMVPGILQRHPMTREELVGLLPDCPEGVLGEVLESLRADGTLQVVRRLGREFWVWGGAFFPDEAASRPPRLLRSCSPTPPHPRPRPGRTEDGPL